MHIKILGSAATICQESGCEEVAAYLFRGAVLAAYCEFHAKAKAGSLGVELPLAQTRQTHAGVIPTSSAIKRTTAA